jgi:hypothetical protein
LRPTARLSGILRHETRRLHAARRRDAVSVIARRRFWRFGCQVSGSVGAECCLKPET